MMRQADVDFKQVLHALNDGITIINTTDWAIDFINRHAQGDYAAVVEGTSDDIVRSGFCKAVVKAMELDNEGGE